MKRTKKLIGLVLCALPFMGGGRLWAQDTTKIKHEALPEVEITTQRTPSTLHTAAPTQVIDQRQIERIGASQLSDAVRQMAGITLKDYGGVGGVKTVSVRGLGSQFSGLSVDGITANDAQNGQIDLGRYLVGNSAYISCSNGQTEELLQSARAVSAGSLIEIESQRPLFWPGEKTHLKAGFEGGSFGHLSPTLGWQQRLGKRVSLSAWGQYVQSAGNYPFTLYYTHSRTDSSSVERRRNSQMRMGVADLHLFWNPDADQQVEGKVHYTQSYHALPGPVVYYSSKASEHTEAQLLFTQMRYRYRPSEGHWHFQLLGKYQLSNDLYEDTAANTLSRRLLNQYQQQEGYLSAAASYRVGRYWHLGAAADGYLNTLKSNLKSHNEVQRGTLLTTLTAQFQHPVVSASGHLLGTLVSEGEQRYQQLSPYLGIQARIVEHNGWSWRARAFYKESYRVPNFNELYYNSVPRTLEPERAQQYNLGTTLAWDLRDSSNTRSIHTQLTLDGYYNHVSNKIVAVPTQNMFLWSMMNVGKVQITGLDIRLQVEGCWKNLSLTLTPFYSHQRAIDITEAGSKTYGHQIAYTPRNSGGSEVYLTTPWVEIGYTLLATGERYYKAQNSASSRLPGYVDQSITMARSFSLRWGTLRLRLQVLNLLDVQYEVVKSYPMMGRNWRVGATWEI